MLTSLRAKLRLMLFLLALIIPLMLLNYYMNQAAGKLDQTHGTITKVNEQLINNIAAELSAIGNPVKFSLLEKNYQTLYGSCTQCHRADSGAIIKQRSKQIGRASCRERV